MEIKNKIFIELIDILVELLPETKEGYYTCAGCQANYMELSSFLEDNAETIAQARKELEG